MYCSIGIVIVLCVLSYFRIQSNSARANRLADALVGKTFIASGTEDEIDYSYPYGNADKVVGSSKYVRKETFNEDFTVTETYTHTDTYDSDYLTYAQDAYPQLSYLRNDTFTDTYSVDFGVKITFWGKVILTEGYGEYELKVNSNDLPVSYNTSSYEYKLKE